MNGKQTVGIMEVMSYILFSLFIPALIFSFFIDFAFLFFIFVGVNFIVAEVAVNRNMLSDIQQRLRELEQKDSKESK